MKFIQFSRDYDLRGTQAQEDEKIALKKLDMMEMKLLNRLGTRTAG